jgi:DNA-binding LytR/AlgR family response regulator
MLAVAASIFLAGVGAFGSGAAPLVLRISYWFFVMLSGAALLAVVVDQFHQRGWLEESAWLKGTALAVLISVPQTVLVWAATNWFFDDPWRPGRMIPLYPQVLLVTAAYMFLHLVLGREPVETHADAQEHRGQPAFLDRLPPRLRGAELYAVEAEDHFLRLHTALGSDLIAMRLTDAISELEGIEGAQIHRSWWVARDAVQQGVRRRGRALLTLKGGLQVPVSRTYAPALRRAHWF